MALAQVYTAVPGDTITAARWNNEFGNIYNNGSLIAFPLTAAVSFAGYTITWDGAGVTTMSSGANNGILFAPGTKSGAPSATVGHALSIAAHTTTDTSTAGSGTATAQVGVSIAQPTFAATNSSVVTTDAATLYIAAAPANGTNNTITNPWAQWVDAGNVRFDGDLRVDGNLRSTAALGFYIQGLTYDNGTDATNDLNINIGMATSNDAAQANRRTMTLATALGKQSDVAWAVGGTTGTPAGGLDDIGSAGNNDFYIWLIMRPDTGVVDALFSLSSTAPTMPASYTYKRLIGWFKRVGGTVVAMTTYETMGGGLELMWTTPTLDVNLANTLTTARRTDAVKVPLNFSTIAHINVLIYDAAATAVCLIYCPDQADLTPSLSAAPLGNANSITAKEAAYQMFIRTSATGTIAARSLLATVDSYLVSTLGFTWARRN